MFVESSIHRYEVIRGCSMKSLTTLWADAAGVCGAPKGEFSKPPSYLEYYEKHFSSRRYEKLQIVEIGVFRGQFLETLAHYFPNSSILGIDQLPDRVQSKSNNITLVAGDQADKEGLRKIFEDHVADGADIIIDDASHVAELTQSCFEASFPYLKSGGSYFVEDWATGYWKDWPDGEPFVQPAFRDVGTDGFSMRRTTHDFGMVGLIKGFVDYVGAPEQMQSAGLSSLEIVPGIARLSKL